VESIYVVKLGDVVELFSCSRTSFSLREGQVRIFLCCSVVRMNREVKTRYRIRTPVYQIQECDSVDLRIINCPVG
jgi:hypothetical protein